MDLSKHALPNQWPIQDQIEIRENILAWISRDIGLCHFCIPQALAEKWTAEQKQAWTSAVIANYVHASTPKGKEARMRVLAREAAGNLRRLCLKLRNQKVSHLEPASMSIAIEGLWDDVNTEFSDSKWARCSLLFDTALISLRVSYLWLYLKTENAQNDETPETRKSVFLKLVSSFFTPGAPTDDNHDKHSTNFRDLLSAWNKELSSYVEGNDFEEKLKLLEETQGLSTVASSVERFVNAVSCDDSWVMKMKATENKIETGDLVPKGTRGRKKKTNQNTPRKESKFVYISDDGMERSISSQEPDANDEDFEINEDKKFVVSTSTDDDLTNSEDEYDRRYRRSRTSRRNKGSYGYSRSGRTSSRNGMPAREVRRPERFSPEDHESSYYVSRTRGPIRPIAKKKRTVNQKPRQKTRFSQVVSSEDDRPVISLVSPRRSKTKLEPEAQNQTGSDSDDINGAGPAQDMGLKNSNFRLHGDDDPESDFSREERAPPKRVKTRTSRKNLRDPVAQRSKQKRNTGSVFSDYDDESLPEPQTDGRRTYRSTRD